MRFGFVPFPNLASRIHTFYLFPSEMAQSVSPVERVRLWRYRIHTNERRDSLGTRYTCVQQVSTIKLNSMRMCISRS